MRSHPSSLQFKVGFLHAGDIALIAFSLENVRKHEIDFANVPEMFEGSMLIELDDRFDYGEDR